MKLFLLEYKDEWDLYVSCVVAAPDEATARTIHPDPEIKELLEDTSEYSTWVGRDSMDKLRVRYI
jgi:hypothetical protein